MQPKEEDKQIQKKKINKWKRKKKIFNKEKPKNENNHSEKSKQTKEQKLIAMRN